MDESGRLIDLLRMWFNDASALGKSERDETFSAFREPLNPIYKESGWACTAVEFLVAHARDNSYLDDSLRRTLNGIALNAEPAASTEARAFLLVYYRDFSQLEPLSSILLDADNPGFSDALAAFASRIRTWSETRLVKFFLKTP